MRIVVPENPRAIGVMKRKALADPMGHLSAYRYLPCVNLDPISMFLGDNGVIKIEQRGQANVDRHS